jgi:hypothetical protein
VSVLNESSDRAPALPPVDPVESSVVGPITIGSDERTTTAQRVVSAQRAAGPDTSNEDAADDQLALGLRIALDCITPAMARVAARLVPLRAWVLFGFARADDFVREKLGRSGRWLRNLRALGEALQRSPRLSDALTGRDGKPPIGQVAVLAIARIASERSTPVWVDLARRLPIRRFKHEVQRARRADSEWPLAPAGIDDKPVALPDLSDQTGCKHSDAPTTTNPGRPDTRGDGPAIDNPNPLWRSRQDDDLTHVRLAVPRSIRIAFDEVRQLHHAVCGADRSTASLVDDLVGEAYAGPHPPDPDVFRLPMVRDQDALETLLFRNTGQWKHLGYRSHHPQAIKQLTEAADLIRSAGQGGPKELCGQLQMLIALEDRLQRQLGKVLASIGHQRGWTRLEFAGLGHYAEQRLGISRTTARDRAWLYRVLFRYPVVRKAYEEDRIGLEATLLTVRALQRRVVGPEIEKRWVERAERATVKRLRDEVRVIHRERTTCEPLTDSEWYASLKRAPGDARETVKRLGLEAADRWMPHETLGLTLVADQAVEFLAAVDGWKQALGREEGPDGWVVTGLARTYSAQGRPLPRWLGLLAMLEDFVETWDDPRAMPRRKADRIYIRDGWRCTAPGCSSRKNLESHHLKYRSRGGDLRSEANQITLCRFHHHMGEHGAFAKCSGTAPLDIVWRLGKEGMETTYRNEKLAAP